MAATIGNLRAVLSAHTEKFNRNIQGARNQVTGFRGTVGSASKQVSRFQGTMGSASRALGGLGKMLAAFVGFRVITSQIKRTVDFMDQIGKLSDRLGASTQFLAGMTHAAQIYGTTQETVIKGLQDFTRRLAEANAGYGEAVRGLGALNLSAKELAKLPLEQAFYKTARGISELTNKTEQARVAYTLFGRSGREMMSMLQANQEEIKNTVGRWKWFDREAAAHAEKFNDWMTEFKAFRMVLGGKWVGGLGDVFKGLGKIVEHRSITKGLEALRDEVMFREEALAVAGHQRRLEQQRTALMARQVQLAKEHAGWLERQKVVVATYQAAAARRREKEETLLTEHDPLYRYKKALDELLRPAAQMKFEGERGASLWKALQQKHAKLKREYLEARKPPEAKAIFERTRTPLEMFQRQKDRLDRLLEQGAFKHLRGRETYLRELKTRWEDYQEAFKKKWELPKPPPVRFAAAATPGTEVAYSSIIRRLKPGVQDQQLEQMKKLLVEAAGNRRANEEQLHQQPKFNLVTIPN